MMAQQLLDPIGEIKSILLRQIPIGISRVLSKYDLEHLMNNHNFQSFEDRFCEGMVYTLRVYLAGNTKSDVKMVENTVAGDPVPTSWWQMLKRDHAPEWFKKRWPVVTSIKHYTVMQEVSYSETRVCPHADVAWPDNSHLHFLTYEDKQFDMLKYGESKEND